MARLERTKMPAKAPSRGVQFIIDIANGVLAKFGGISRIDHRGS